MFYKEWIAVRFKFYLMLGLYGLASLLTLVLWLSGRSFSGKASLFYSWLTLNLIITLAAGVLAGAGLISEETGNETISFLLTRPLSRFRIYAGKILVNVLALVAAFGLVNGLMLGLSSLDPRHHDAAWTVPTFQAGEPGMVIQTLLMGITVVCLGGLLSIFIHNLMVGVIVNVIMTLIGFQFYIIFIFKIVLKEVIVIDRVDPDGTVRFSVPQVMQVSQSSWNLSMVLFLTGLIVVLFWLGKTAFARKEF